MRSSKNRQVVQFVFILIYEKHGLLKALWEGHTAALQIMLAEAACDLQIVACH